MACAGLLCSRVSHQTTTRWLGYEVPRMSWRAVACSREGERDASG